MAIIQVVVGVAVPQQIVVEVGLPQVAVGGFPQAVSGTRDGSSSGSSSKTGTKLQMVLLAMGVIAACLP